MNNSFYTVAEFLEHTVNNEFTLLFLWAFLLYCIVLLVLCGFVLFVSCYDQFHVHCILDLWNVKYMYVCMYPTPLVFHFKGLIFGIVTFLWLSTNGVTIIGHVVGCYSIVSLTCFEHLTAGSVTFLWLSSNLVSVVVCVVGPYSVV
jgi:hypothetical protein